MLSLKEYSPTERSLILRIAVKKGWGRAQIEKFLVRLESVLAHRPGPPERGDLLQRTCDLLDGNYMMDN